MTTKAENSVFAVVNKTAANLLIEAILQLTSDL
jgi:hypothetical protein